MKRAVLSLAALLAASANAQAPKPPARRAQVTAAYFLGLQEQAVATDEELAQRRGETSEEGAVAETALNAWKQCIVASLRHWAPLRQGPGTLVEGAFGRCAEQARDYRAALLRLVQDGRPVMDPQLARQMGRSLEEAWRPRLIAAALDQELAALTPPAPPPAP